MGSGLAKGVAGNADANANGAFTAANTLSPYSRPDPAAAAYAEVGYDAIAFGEPPGSLSSAAAPGPSYAEVGGIATQYSELPVGAPSARLELDAETFDGFSERTAGVHPTHLPCFRTSARPSRFIPANRQALP